MPIIEEGTQDTLQIKLTNHLTGEITSVEVKSAEQAKNLLLELSASALAIKKAQESLKSYLNDFLGDDEKYQFADGKILRRIQRESLSYRVETLRKFLDQDQIDLCLAVSTTATNELIGELMERGELPGNALKTVRDEADRKASKPFVEVR